MWWDRNADACDTAGTPVAHQRAATPPGAWWPPRRTSLAADNAVPDRQSYSNFDPELRGLVPTVAKPLQTGSLTQASNKESYKISPTRRVSKPSSCNNANTAKAAHRGNAFSDPTRNDGARGLQCVLGHTPGPRSMGQFANGPRTIRQTVRHANDHNREDRRPLALVDRIEGWLNNGGADELAKWSHAYLAHAGATCALSPCERTWSFRWFSWVSSGKKPLRQLHRDRIRADARYPDRKPWQGRRYT